MAKSWNLRLGGINLTSGEVGDATERPEDLPFRLLVFGNFSGSRSSGALENRKPVFVDRDNFEDVLAKLSPQINLTLEGVTEEIRITFRDLEDFEPDRLLTRLPLFDELRTLLDQLGRSATFEQAAAKVRSWTQTPSETTPAAARPSREVSAADLIEEVLAESAPSQAKRSDDWARFLDQIVQPHLVEKPNPRQADYEAVVEASISARLRAILHHPDFQAIETAWRSLFLLVRRLPTDEKLKIHFLDVRPEELDRDLDQEDPRESVFFREVVQKTVGTSGGQPWAAVVALDTFGSAPADLARLGKMVAIASLAHTPVLAAANSSLVGCRSFVTDPRPESWHADPTVAEAWRVLRSLPEAAYLGITAPRFLLRLPYGKDGTRTDRLDFEEFATEPPHEHYLWGPGSVVCALLLAEGFVESGWSLSPDDHRQMSGLPVHIYDEDGERTMKPCAEVMLREDAFHKLVDRGLMVLISIRERDSIQLARFQSAAAEPMPLAGRWT